MLRIVNRHSTLLRSKLATARTFTPARFFQKPMPKSFFANLKKTSTDLKVLIGGSFVVGGLVGGVAYRMTKPSITLKSLSASDFQTSCNSAPCVLPELKPSPEKVKAESIFRKLIYPSALCVYLPLVFIGEICLLSYSPR